MIEQLKPSELSSMRSLREEDELTFEQIADRLGIDISSAHRALTKPGYQFSELQLIRIRKGLARLTDQPRRRAQKVAAS